MLIAGLCLQPLLAPDPQYPMAAMAHKLDPTHEGQPVTDGSSGLRASEAAVAHVGTGCLRQPDSIRRQFLRGTCCKAGHLQQLTLHLRSATCSKGPVLPIAAPSCQQISNATSLRCSAGAMGPTASTLLMRVQVVMSSDVHTFTWQTGKRRPTTKHLYFGRNSFRTWQQCTVTTLIQTVATQHKT